MIVIDNSVTQILYGMLQSLLDEDERAGRLSLVQLMIDPLSPVTGFFSLYKRNKN